ncbi:hypothetical protein SG34_030645 [Thalassomonas viridans]|uniref:Uncharacterized protein n=1 Tax=Thalassomonas viridans TaxID=137584 RepID=A0AAE9ZAF7_9GAMM|nr:hypothetical protein [Thalassomonas viridans]WDE09127.1 hypothetical protein SG34_030645 [Thalassomonas viridans]
MKIDRDAVMKANEKLLSAYIPGIISNDNKDSGKSMTRGLIQVSPNNLDAKSSTVRFCLTSGMVLTRDHGKGRLG